MIPTTPQKTRRLIIGAVAAMLLAGAGVAAPSTDPAVAAARDAISQQAMSALVKDLSAPAYDGRLPGTPGDSASRDYLVRLFRSIGLKPAGTQGYLLPFTTTITQPDGEDTPANPALGQVVKTSNIIGIIPGNDPVLAHEVILVSGHRDHLGHRPDHVQYPGANDDLSGVAATVELARAFARIRHLNKRTLMFVAFGAEEQEQMGSTYQASHPLPVTPNRNIVLMLSIDMIGRDFDAWSGFSQRRMDRFADRWFAEVYNGTDSHKDAYSFEYPDESDGSDTPVTYDYDAGAFAAHGINTRVIGLATDPNYHSPADTWGHMHFDPMLPVTRTIFDFVWQVDQDPSAHAGE